MVRTYSVVAFPQDWRILTASGWRGRFDCRVDAVEAAMRLALKDGREGRAADVLVQERFGEMRPLDLSSARGGRDAAERDA